jgi:energy-coupling factor transporter ATP-binding protein EcfA2
MIEAVGLRYTYPDGTVGLDGVDLRVAAGSIVWVAGPSGGGKSTLVRLLCGIAGENGVVEGHVQVAGRPLRGIPRAGRPEHVGLVQQEPADQVVAGTIADELAFALESSGWAPDRVAARVAEAIGWAGLVVEGEGHPTWALSGGQVQRLVTAAALAAGARVLLLDEPFAQLDTDAIVALSERVRAFAADGGAVVLVEHRAEACLPLADRVVVLAEGRVALDAPSSAFVAGSAEVAALRRVGVHLPGVLSLADRAAPRPLSACRLATAARPPVGGEGPPLLVARALTWSWPGATRPALDGVRLVVGPGERVAVLGRNGAGKSTLLDRIANDRAAVRTGRLVVVPQDPDLVLFRRTVYDELAYGLLEAGWSRDRVHARVMGLAGLLGVGGKLEAPPHALSRGQRLRVAVGAAWASRPELLVLDEPTAGQDAAHVAAMFDAITDDLGASALLFTTHDIGLALVRATRVVLLAGGRVVYDGPPAGATAKLGAAGLGVPEWVALCASRGLPPCDPDAVEVS